MPGFTNHRWEIINKNLSRNPRRFGCPVRHRNSVVIGSFNALKIGRATNNAKRWEFLKRFVSRYDLLAIQEVTDDLSGIRRLHKSLGSGFELLVSDTTGAAPGSRGLRERLAFLYRPARIELNELVSDITYDRSIIINRLRKDIDAWQAFFSVLDQNNAERIQLGKKALGLSDVAHPGFLSFIRTPYCASFSILGANGAEPVTFLGVNAHTLYGATKVERTREFFALLDWLILRAKQSTRMYAKNTIVMADLNMEFSDAGTRYSDIIKRLHELGSNLLSKSNAARVNFPFLDVHPTQRSLFSTNARRNMTFDHVAFFIDKDEKRLPLGSGNRQAGIDVYDYGVFDFGELFAQSRHGKSFDELSKVERTKLLANAKADVSDHMPIWVRIPIPGA